MLSTAIIAYLFLGGLGGGLLAVASVAGLLAGRRSRTQAGLPSESRIGGCIPTLSRCFIASAATLLLASLCLLADNVRFAALPHLFFSSHPSILTFGAWAIALAMGLSCALAALMRPGTRSAKGRAAMRALLGLAAVAGLCVILYTGLYLAGMKSVALWHTPWLPALFALSSLSCGLAALSALTQADPPGRAQAWLARGAAKADLAVLGLEALSALGFAGWPWLATKAGLAAGSRWADVLVLLTGPQAWAWWFGFVGLGLAAAAAIDALMLRTNPVGRSRNVVMLAAFCAAAGALAMRACIVMAGSHPAVSLGIAAGI